MGNRVSNFVKYALWYRSRLEVNDVIGNLENVQLLWLALGCQSV